MTPAWSARRSGPQALGEHIVMAGPVSSSSELGRQRVRAAWIFLLPMMVVLIAAAGWPLARTIYFSVTGGVGYVKRTGPYFDNHPEITDEQRHDWTGTAGATVGFRLGRLLHLHVSADDYIYKPKLADTDPSFDARTQNDIHLSFGVGIPLLGLGM